MGINSNLMEIWHEKREVLAMEAYVRKRQPEISGGLTEEKFQQLVEAYPALKPEINKFHYKTLKNLNKFDDMLRMTQQVDKEGDTMASLEENKRKQKKALQLYHQGISMMRFTS